ncbi:hypothetical protein E2C01_045590 [Portunus trituberculatus]|uniref:Uncharacterized protein n=1 Tax=Portunus trituberculatus TaxID=210409 RepID=A0A5B7G2H2_PORTR|nr:hypothetical protein [Portunus trituberculatus]
MQKMRAWYWSQVGRGNFAPTLSCPGGVSCWGRALLGPRCLGLPAGGSVNRGQKALGFRQDSEWLAESDEMAMKSTKILIIIMWHSYLICQCIHDDMVGNKAKWVDLFHEDCYTSSVDVFNQLPEDIWFKFFNDKCLVDIALGLPEKEEEKGGGDVEVEALNSKKAKG